MTKIEPALRRQLPVSRDSVFAVLVQLEKAPGEDERGRLAAAGLHVSAVAGNVLTGRIRGADLAALADLPFVKVIQQARRIPITGTGE